MKLNLLLIFNVAALVLCLVMYFTTGELAFLVIPAIGIGAGVPLGLFLASNRYRRWRCRRKGHGALTIIEEYSSEPVSATDFTGPFGVPLRFSGRVVNCKFRCHQCGAVEIGIQPVCTLTRRDFHPPNE